MSIGLEETNVNHDTWATVEPGFRGVEGALRNTHRYRITVAWLDYMFSASASHTTAGRCSPILSADLASPKQDLVNGV